MPQSDREALWARAHGAILLMSYIAAALLYTPARALAGKAEQLGTWFESHRRAPCLLLRRRQPEWSREVISGRELRPVRGHTKQWASYEPRPVLILASRIIQIDPVRMGPAYFPLGRGEFIQCLLASIGDHQRVYVVTVPAPAQYAGRWADWPRVVGIPETSI